MPSSPLPPNPRTLPSLPPRKVSAILAAGMLAAGIALGALIGPAPASSLASGARAAAVARVLALLALGEGAGSGSQLLLPGSAGYGHASTRQATGHATGFASKPSSSAAASGRGGASGGQSETSPTSTAGSSPSGSASPTRSKPSPAASGESKPVRLAPVAHVWLIVLPSGEGFTNVIGQPATAPYTTGVLLRSGTLLSDYSSLAASELAGDATLLSGQVAAALSTIVAPCPSAPSTSGTGAPSATAPAASSPAATDSAPCTTAEPVGVQAADAFLHAVVPPIEASAAYREGGLIAITFAAAGEGTSPVAATTPTPGAPRAGSPSTGTPGTDSPALAYPAGTQVSTATAAGTPGALLLSPYLARPGARLTSAFDQLAPRKSLEELLRDPSKTAHQ